MNIQRWRRLTAQRGEPGYKTFNQATYIVPAENPKASPQAIHQGLSLGRDPLLEFFNV
ncbi:hypothetical protein [Glutamicibacter sp.]|uniref:hypothetical protein n=1 Tax=Glutamicibacter sp. TaxID=1931995 RepID=UPI002FE4023C